MAGEGAGVDAFDAGHTVFLEEFGQGTDGTPVGGRLAAFLDDERRRMDFTGLHIFRVDAVVADERPRHAHHLPVIGGVGEDFLIAGHAGVENDFAAALAGAGEGTSLKHKTIFQSQ